MSSAAIYEAQVRSGGAVASAPGEWKPFEKVLFRIAFIYFVIQCVPLDWKFYRQVFQINWLNLTYGDIFELSRYQPRFFSGPDTWANWAVILLIAIVGGIVWGNRDKDKKEYNQLYYWLRVIVRYRLAAGLIAYGFIKFFPLQAPPPSLSNLNTAYGDFSAWKLFALSLGVVPDYQSFLGLVELAGGLLLLHRRTTTLATLIIIPFTGNVFISNLAYEGGEYIYSFYLIVLALFLFAFDANRLNNLLTLGKPTFPNRFKPVFSQNNIKQARIAFKGAFVLFFVVIYGYKSYAGYHNYSYQYPTKPGLAQAAGLYNVEQFVLNGDTLAYSPLDPVRWKDVVFENWATLSIRSSPPAVIDSANVEHIDFDDARRNYEQSGSGGRHYYSYEHDPASKTLKLTNKVDASDRLTLHYSRPDSTTILLSGVGKSNDSLYVALKKINKKYLFQEVQKVGRRGEFKL
ncbi:DoxX family protein [Dyadobacter sp. CY351]|uniref:DoxX family protein n=1 Tax=Dyadobacter sp. CY351 TaxID=2909337 RepID=UPI001F19E901|nr:DoxX family protein [Dyadobacter sp. CY351]MCF2517575.1 DoxX family protein [Dyadobacter sp. CY351]